MNDDIAIKVENVSKIFKLPHEKHSSIKSSFINVFSSKKGYELQKALQDVSFEVKKGEFFGIVGRNGSGKSTLLKIIASIYVPTEGTVQVRGKLVPFIELGVGFNPELTGRENVYLNGALLGFSNKEIREMYEDIVSFAELEKFMDQKLKNYSSGMQVRLAFSMAIRAEAGVLLIDEVLAVGDASFQRKCFQYFRQLKREKKTIIFVTHDMNAVREYCDRAILVESSKLVAIDTADEVARLYEKLLSKDSRQDNSTNQEKSERWGDGSLKITNASVEKVTENEVAFRMTVEAQQDIDNAIFGFVIKNSAGTSLLGTNTLVEKIKPATFKRKTRQIILWSIPNIFSDGSYSVALAVIYDSGVSTADWWEDACKFTISKLSRTPYPVAPKVKISIKAG